MLCIYQYSGLFPFSVGLPVLQNIFTLIGYIKLCVYGETGTAILLRKPHSCSEIYDKEYVEKLQAHMKLNVT